MNSASQFDNPYLTPETVAAIPPPLISDADAIRREHYNTESSVRTLGVLYYLSGGILTLGSIATGMDLLLGKGGSRDPEMSLGVFAFMLLLGPALIILGRALRKFQPSARICAIIVSVIGLIGIPIGTLISAIILGTIAGKKGAMVFSPAYKEIMATTTKPKSKTTIGVWIVLGIALAIIAFAVLLMLFARH